MCVLGSVDRQKSHTGRHNVSIRVLAVCVCCFVSVYVFVFFKQFYYYL